MTQSTVACSHEFALPESGSCTDTVGRAVTLKGLRFKTVLAFGLVPRGWSGLTTYDSLRDSEIKGSLIFGLSRDSRRSNFRQINSPVNLGLPSSLPLALSRRRMVESLGTRPSGLTR